MTKNESPLDAAARQDLRRQEQVQRQVEIINRLLNGATYDDLMREQTEEIAALRSQRKNVLKVIHELQAEDRITLSEGYSVPANQSIIEDLASAIELDL